MNLVILRRRSLQGTVTKCVKFSSAITAPLFLIHGLGDTKTEPIPLLVLRKEVGITSGVKGKSS